ncbi:Biotin transporter BioY [Thermoflexales bacterium]|nr:Biotin transporter BioY [Thermoflexales bacterium]
MLLSRIQARSSNPALVRAAAILLFAALTAISARLTILLPFTPVPITLQVMIVLLAGLTLGAKDGALSQILYVTTIAFGLPFDAKGIGAAAFAGATAGYLIGFIPAAFITGWLTEKGARGKRVWSFAASLIGVAVIYTIGTAWLTIGVLSNDWSKGWALGAAPFIIVDTIKALLAAVCAEGTRAGIDRVGH